MYCSIRSRFTANVVSWLNWLTLPMGERSASVSIARHSTSNGSRKSSGPKSLSSVLGAVAVPRMASGLNSIWSANGAVCSIISTISGASSGFTRSSMRMGAGRLLTYGRIISALSLLAAPVGGENRLRVPVGLGPAFQN